MRNLCVHNYKAVEAYTFVGDTIAKHGERPTIMGVTLEKCGEVRALGRVHARERRAEGKSLAYTESRRLDVHSCPPKLVGQP